MPETLLLGQSLLLSGLLEFLWPEEARVQNPAFASRQHAHRTHGVNKEADHHDFFITKTGFTDLFKSKCRLIICVMCNYKVKIHVRQMTE